MLLQLLTKYLAPYKATIAAIVALQLAATIASLYLPSLNADIIDNGVVRGDTGYILRVGVLDARNFARAGDRLHRGRLLRRSHGHGIRARSAQRGVSSSGGVLEPRGGDVSAPHR